MQEEKKYSAVMRVRNMFYQADSYKISAVELHRHHFDTFEESFALLLSLDEKYFNESFAARVRSAISIESVDINTTGKSAADEPTIISAVRGGDSPLINEPPGLYFIIWNGFGNSASDYGIHLEDFRSYDAERMLLSVAHFDNGLHELKIDPAYERLKHRHLQQYLSEKRYCISTLCFASNLNLPGEWNFSGPIVDVWHFNSIQGALSSFIAFDIQLLDAGYCTLNGENRYYEGVQLYEERGDCLLSLNANLYEPATTNEKAKGIYLHYDQHTILGRFIQQQLGLDDQNKNSFLAAKYESSYHYTGPSTQWLQFKSVLSAFKNKKDVIKRRSRSPILSCINNNTGIKQ